MVTLKMMMTINPIQNTGSDWPIKAIVVKKLSNFEYCRVALITQIGIEISSEPAKAVSAR